MGPTLGFQPPILGIVAECQTSLKRLARALRAFSFIIAVTMLK